MCHVGKCFLTQIVNWAFNRQILQFSEKARCEYSPRLPEIIHGGARMPGGKASFCSDLIQNFREIADL